MLQWNWWHFNCARGTFRDMNGKFQGQDRGIGVQITVTFGGTIGTYMGKMGAIECHFVVTYNIQFGGKNGQISKAEDR